MVIGDWEWLYHVGVEYELMVLEEGDYVWIGLVENEEVVDDDGEMFDFDGTCELV